MTVFSKFQPKQKFKGGGNENIIKLANEKKLKKEFLEIKNTFEIFLNAFFNQAKQPLKKLAYWEIN